VRTGDADVVAGGYPSQRVATVERVRRQVRGR
jgi:hypothetical protein